ncbi:MAG TPA: hypothetical protein VFZ61_12740, partial [Polyangiales bacterium]
APVPPREPLAWLPEDVSLVGRVSPPALRSTPLWSLWELVLKEPAAQGALVDPQKITRAVFAGSETEEHKISFVAALSGDFGPSSVDAAAKLAQLPPETLGLLTFYRRDQVAYAQVYDDLVLVCSLDRVEPLSARASQGDAVKIREGALFHALGQRLRWDDVDFVLIGEDPSGRTKARAERQAERVGYSLPLKDLLRAGVALKLDDSTAGILVAAQAPDEAGAAALRTALTDALDSLGNNVLVALVGLRSLVRALSPRQAESFVEVSGSLARDEFNGAMVRLLGLVGIEAAPAGAPEPAP